MTSSGLVWLRRDLPVLDNPALATALSEHGRVVPVLVLDRRLFYGRFPTLDRARGYPQPVLVRGLQGSSWRS